LLKAVSLRSYRAARRGGRAVPLPNRGAGDIARVVFGEGAAMALDGCGRVGLIRGSCFAINTGN
jgi:hypothetical protein